MKMIKFIKFTLNVGLSITVAVILGFYSVDWAISHSDGSIRNGPWETDMSWGSADAGPYQKARIAKQGIWALASSEVIYYVAYTDSNGETLRCDDTYLIDGAELGARWWSLTAYANDHFIPNPDDRYSFSSTTVTREGDDTWVIVASPNEHDRNWLPLGKSTDKLSFMLRCYNPSQSMRDDPGSVSLPKIVRKAKP